MIWRVLLVLPLAIFWLGFSAALLRRNQIWAVIGGGLALKAVILEMILVSAIREDIRNDLALSIIALMVLLLVLGAAGLAVSLRARRFNGTASLEEETEFRH